MRDDLIDLLYLLAPLNWAEDANGQMRVSETCGSFVYVEVLFSGGAFSPSVLLVLGHSIG